MLPRGRKMCGLKISIKGFAFLYVKVNSKEICGEISLPSFTGNY